MMNHNLTFQIKKEKIMFKKSLALLVAVFMLSVFHISELAYSYPNLPAGTEQARKYNGILIKLGNRERNL